jgi:methanogenesis multiheme c-type cytochrome
VKLSPGEVNVKSLKPNAIFSIMLLFVFFVFLASANATDVVESSYHGQLGRSPALGGWGNGLGMLEKWCALPNFSFEKQGRIKGWMEQCGKCHTSSYRDPATGKTDCTLCHKTRDGKGEPTIAQCVKCHVKDYAKRGDIFDEEHDIHLAAGMRCHDCHERLTDPHSDHQFAKGYAIDTTEDTMEGTLSCLKCHEERPHYKADEGEILDSKHVNKIACVTCHTGPRPGKAIESRSWNEFTEDGKPVTKMRAPGWIPNHKWYTGKKLGHLPILGSTDLMAKIYPFNVVKVTWFIETSGSSLDDVIIVPEVMAADADNDRVTTVEEMRKYQKGKYSDATLVTREFNFSVSHSIVPSENAFSCFDCHGEDANVIQWKELGYMEDPYE